MRNAHMPLWFFGLCLSAEAQQRTVTLFDRLCEDWLFDTQPAPITRRLHVTLFPLGPMEGKFADAPPGAVADACAAADSIGDSPFDVSFDRAINRRGTQIALTADRPCDALFSFQQKLCAALRHVGMRAVKGWRFDPHVTLRNRENILVDQPVSPVSWRVDEFVLIESLKGRTIHNHRRKWSLGGAGNNAGLTAAA